MSAPDFHHVIDTELRAILDGTLDCGPEELRFAVKATQAAWEIDKDNPGIGGISHALRAHAVETIDMHWGDGEDGDAATLQACRDYWSV